MGIENAGKRRLVGKVALVTAAAQGIGAMTAQRMVEEGATVIVTDIQAEKVEALGKSIGCLGLMLDATDEQQWQSVVDLLTVRFGQLDILVNNVGFADQRPFWEYSLADFRRHFEINTETAFLGTKLCMSLLEKGAGMSGVTSSVVHVASVAAVGGYAAQLPYNAAKAALVSMSKTMAVEFARHGKPVRSNSVLPGVVNTAILKKWFDAASDLGLFGDGSHEERWAAMTHASPMKRLGLPADIANAILYLASDEAAYVNGTELRVDGAWTAGG